MMSRPVVLGKHQSLYKRTLPKPPPTASLTSDVSGSSPGEHVPRVELDLFTEEKQRGSEEL